MCLSKLKALKPPSLANVSDRRVDLVIKRLDDRSASTVLFMEAKKHGATQGEVIEAETQVWQAANEYTINLPTKNICPVWLQTCIGTTTRFWIYYPHQEFPIPFLPSNYDLGYLDEYLEADNYSRLIMKALTYIANHPIPPPKFLWLPTPLVSTVAVQSLQYPRSPSSVSRQRLEDTAAAAVSQIPLSQSAWVGVEILRNTPEGIVGHTEQGFEYTFPFDQWRPQRRKLDGRDTACYVHIGPDRTVY
ncbi:hypothetical protein F5883DRAFT_622647 [Diaporthe sp. PMI_573]|nr:hypothetical protein F5883DRAFT_622647 [Diaporthaceae sp. PMI_573]